jgi:hypothetical protein
MEPSSFVHCDDLYCNLTLAKADSAAPTTEHLEEMEKALTVLLTKCNNSKKLVGLKDLSAKVKAGEVVTEDHTIPLPAKSNYSLHSSFKFI